MQQKLNSNLCFFHVALLKFNVTNGCHTQNFSLNIIFDLEQRKLLEYMHSTCVLSN